MPKIEVNGLPHYFEQVGQGASLVFIHGAFADSRIWELQWHYFSSQYRLVRYDLRGHGKTGASRLDRYSMNTFADDLTSLLDSLEIFSPILCGLSWGGSIAQVFAARNPKRVTALVLAGSSVSIRLTLMDRLLCDVLFPKWAMLLAIRLLSVENLTRFLLRLARLTRGKQWLSQNQTTTEYLENCMLAMDSNEYVKIWEAMYGFDLFPLENITCPTLVLNGEYEPKSAYQHTKEILRRVSQSKAGVIPRASHAMNMDNPEGFNRYLEKFLKTSI
ncbi:MAG: alpha/beta hydrolase [Anaerolineales bacterium]